MVIWIICFCPFSISKDGCNASLNVKGFLFSSKSFKVIPLVLNFFFRERDNPHITVVGSGNLFFPPRCRGSYKLRTKHYVFISIISFCLLSLFAFFFVFVFIFLFATATLQGSYHYTETPTSQRRATDDIYSFSVTIDYQLLYVTLWCLRI